MTKERRTFSSEFKLQMVRLYKEVGTCEGSKDRSGE